MNNNSNRQQTSPRRPQGLKLTRLRAGAIIILVVVVALLIMMSDKQQQPQWQYDLSEHLRIDPALIKYEEVGRVKTGLHKPRGIAIGRDDLLHVVGDRSIRIFDIGPPPGTTLGPREWVVPDSPKRVIPLGGEPRCVAVAEDGTIYLGMKNHVEVYAAQGGKIAAWKSFGDKARITSVAVAGKEVYVADYGDRVILRCDTSGAVLTRIGEKDPQRNIPGLVAPSPHLDVAVAPDGLVRVSNPGRHRIEAYTREGDLEFWWGKPSAEVDGFCGCCNPTDFVVTPDGEVITSEKGLARVKVYEDVSGKFLGVVAAPVKFAEATAYGFLGDFPGFDLAVDSNGRVLVLDPGTRTVRVFVRKPEAKDE